MRKFYYFLAGVLFLRLLFATFIPLIDDEAYHWTWSWGDNLSLSYFDHPAMIAWLERMSTSLFGATYLGVRLPSFICFVLTTLVFMKIALEMFGEAAAKFVALMILFVPIWGFGGHVASPEPPFILCWALGLWVFWQGYREDIPESKRWSLQKTWLLLGVIMGLGLNSKFIIAMLAFGFGVYFILTPHRRKDLLTPWPWLGIVVATLICSPIFIWNIQNDWPGFRYQFHDRHTGETFNLGRGLGFLAAQFLFYTPSGYVLLVFAFVASFFKIQDSRWRIILATALPSLVIFYPQPFFAEYKPHWSGAAMMILLLGAGAIWQEGLTLRGKNLIRAKSRVLKISLLVFLVPLNLIIYSPFLGPWWPTAYKWITGKEDFDTKWDLSNEFYGWEEVGPKAVQVLEEMKQKEGKDVFLAAHRYETTAQLTWGAKHPVYMLSSTVSHYTVKQKHHGLLEPLMGQSAVFVASEKYQANPMEWARWDGCEEERFVTYRMKTKAREFQIWKCRNFQGIIR